MWRWIKATEVQPGTVVDDERFQYVMEVGHVTTATKAGVKMIAMRAFHPDANVYPNNAYYVPVDGSVRVV